MIASNLLITKIGVSSPTNLIAGLTASSVLEGILEGFNRQIPENVANYLKLETVDGDKRFWKVSETYRDPSTNNLLGIILKCKSNNARLVLRARNGAPGPNIFCSYHPVPEDSSEPSIDLNASFQTTLPSYLTAGGSPELRFSGGNTATTSYSYSTSSNYINSASGPKLRTNAETFDSGFLIEFNDAITIVFFKNNSVNAWGQCCHAGTIFSNDNLSDVEYGIDGSGIMCGYYGSSNSNGNANYNLGQTSYVIQSRIKVGNELWGIPEVDFHYPSSFNHGASYTSEILPIDWKDSNETNIERLIPLRIRSTNSTYSNEHSIKKASIGCVGHTRYLKQRCLANTGLTGITYWNLSSGAHLKTVKNTINGSTGSVQILNLNDVLKLEGTPYSWIHQAGDTAVTVAQNIVHLWLNNDEVNTTAANYNIIF